MNPIPYGRQHATDEDITEKAFYDECLCILMFPTLTEQKQKYIIDTIHQFFSK